jgi:hypothetical protein
MPSDTVIDFNQRRARRNHHVPSEKAAPHRDPASVFADVEKACAILDAATHKVLASLEPAIAQLELAMADSTAAAAFCRACQSAWELTDLDAMERAHAELTAEYETWKAGIPASRTGR